MKKYLFTVKAHQASSPYDGGYPSSDSANSQVSVRLLCVIVEICSTQNTRPDQSMESRPVRDGYMSRLEFAKVLIDCKSSEINMPTL